MPPTNKTRQLIEFKGTTLPVVVVTLRSLHPNALTEAASALFGNDEFFDGDAALLELSQIVDVPEPDWRRVQAGLEIAWPERHRRPWWQRGTALRRSLRRLADLCSWRTFSPPRHALPSARSFATARNSPDQCSRTPADGNRFRRRIQRSSLTGRYVPDNRFTHAVATSWYWPRSMPERRSSPMATSTSMRPCTGARWPAPAAQPGANLLHPLRCRTGFGGRSVPDLR
jgi:hypothetical protein